MHRRRERPRLHRMLDDGKQPLRLVPPDLEVQAEAADPSEAARARFGDEVAHRDRAWTCSATSAGVRPTLTPLASRASALASAVPDEPVMVAPAGPIFLPGGAEKPAM